MSHHILIADDAAMNRRLVKNILSPGLPNSIFGEAANGEEVIEYVKYNQVDLIILDLLMPIMDGYETLKWLKQMPQYHDIPVIVNSAITAIKSIEETLKEGAIDYFTKPLTTNDMQIILPLKAKNALLYYEQQREIARLNNQINEELKNANAFANIMLPRKSHFEHIELFMKYHPSLGIGGDFFDCVEREGRLHFMVADVTGHGIAAGMASSMVKVMYRKIIERTGIMPHEVLEDMNRTVFEIFDFAGKDNYLVFTAFVGIIEGNNLYYANAGQPYPLLFNAEQERFTLIEQNGFVIGMMDAIPYKTEQVFISEGDLIFLYTDGLFCSGEGTDFSGWEKVLSMSQNFTNVLSTDEASFLDEVFFGFHMIHKSKQVDFDDDVALVLIKKKSS